MRAKSHNWSVLGETAEANGADEEGIGSTSDLLDLNGSSKIKLDHERRLTRPASKTKISKPLGTAGDFWASAIYGRAEVRLARHTRSAQPIRYGALQP